jgi:transcriptional regulator with XRE-family HTH domain
MTNEALARKLRILRAARGISLREAEKLTGVTRETLGALEHGQRGAHTGTLQKIATGYGVSVSDLMREGLEAEEVLLSKAEASEAGAREAKVALESPRVWAWLVERGAVLLLMSDEDFGNEVTTSEPNALLASLREERDRLLKEIDKRETRDKLFPTNVAAQGSKQARISEAMRPYRQVGRLRRQATHEYGIKERILENYIKHLSMIEAESDKARRQAFREEREAEREAALV